MIKKIVTLMMMVALASTCTPAPGWKASPLEDQVKYAGAIVRGTVADVDGDVNQSSVVLHNAVFYRGRGPSEITVEGFSNDALCGVNPPDLNTEVFVFLCRKDGAWVLNNINLFTGAVEANDDNIEIVEHETIDDWRFENSSTIQYKACGKPPKKQPKPCYDSLSVKPGLFHGIQWKEDEEDHDHKKQDPFWKKYDKPEEEEKEEYNNEEEGDSGEEEQYDTSDGWGDDESGWDEEEKDDQSADKEKSVFKIPIGMLIGATGP